MSDDYPADCPLCGCQMGDKDGVYKCGTKMVDPLGKHPIIDESDDCRSSQLDSAIAALEQAVPLLMSHQKASGEGEHTIHWIKLIIESRNYPSRKGGGS